MHFMQNIISKYDFFFLVEICFHEIHPQFLLYICVKIKRMSSYSSKRVLMMYSQYNNKQEIAY